MPRVVSTAAAIITGTTPAGGVQWARRTLFRQQRPGGDRAACVRLRGRAANRRSLTTMLGLLGLFATLPLTTLGEGLVDLTLYGGAFEASSTIAYAEVCRRVCCRNQ